MICLITGTSSGIGLSLAVDLAQRGHQVVATMRNTAKAERLKVAATEAGVKLDIRELDVTNESQVAGVIDAVVEEHGSIDVLVNNAGAPYVGSLEQVSYDQLNATMDVNFTGTATATREAMRHMRAAGSGHIISVSSVGGCVGQPFNDAYCAAKFAVEGLMQSLHPVAAQFGVHVSIVQPGPVASDFITNAGESVAERQADPSDPYAGLFGNYLARTAGAFDNAQTPAEVAAMIGDVAESQAPAFRYQTSERATMFSGMSLSDLDGSTVGNATATWIA